MIEKPIALQAIKKEPFSGSYKGLRFRFERVEDMLETAVYPEPFSYEKTDPALIKKKQFEFGEDGYMEALAWINEEYDAMKKED